MTDKEELDYYREVMHDGLLSLCNAVGMDVEKFDDDQAEGECYRDGFAYFADVLQDAGIKWDAEENEMVIPMAAQAEAKFNSSNL